jgi:hypothetical protein
VCGGGGRGVVGRGLAAGKKDARVETAARPIEFERGEPEDGGRGRGGSLNGAFHSRRASTEARMSGAGAAARLAKGGRERNRGDAGGRPRYQHIE